MKRFTTLAALLLSLTAGSIALAAGGPGKFETKITGKSAKAEHGRLDGTWTVDFANPMSGKVKLTWDGRPDWRRQVRHHGLDDHAYAQEGWQLQDQGHVPVQAERQDANFHDDQRPLRRPQGHPDLRPVDPGGVNRLARRGV